ncbi:MAG: 50S ribosomal protein L18 [Candidatus Bathyarchaeota archaeon]|nr:50S ribosomal protein L18 [Candidatus Bathyarchaeota archaeon]MDH5419585.1 50S ribosomal protein L18 [Candidatus Bathyarchaeota archaeon]MDH5623947.1 50S ribosomal protein L18 [Candidatus Bathyarchaeota archaeon]MDH5636279.1 50S ribosomal protein L18 [Candidatus Bathyarchaeota archaeon]
MATGPSYRVPFRRRREGKTDYRSRRALVLSRLPRLVVRLTLNHIIVQVVEAEVAGDKGVVSAHSRELAKTYGWQGNCRNVPAAYLTGLLCGFKAMVHGVKKAVLDIGLHSPSRGARVFAALKGVLDAGVTVPHSENMLPDETRIIGKHIADYGSQLSSNPEIYQQRFSKHLSRGLRPEQLSEHFSLIKEKITSSFKEKKGT